MSVKRALVNVAGDKRTIPVMVSHDMTADKVLQEIGLPGYVLVREHDSKNFLSSDLVYPRIENNEKLDATLPVVVGSSEPTPFFHVILIGASLLSLGVFLGSLTYFARLFVLAYIRRGLSSSPVRQNKRAMSSSSNARKRPIERKRKAKPINKTKSYRNSRSINSNDRILEIDSRPFHIRQGWKKRGNNWGGFYRAGQKKYPGKIIVRSSNDYVYTIRKISLDTIPSLHRGCFFKDSKNGYRVHFSTEPRTISDGILAIESILIGGK